MGMTRRELLEAIFGVDTYKETIDICPNDCEHCSQEPSARCTDMWWGEEWKENR